MDVSTKEIARLCGVSRGTVDRVLHKRGKVKKETEQRIKAVLKEVNYKPNPAGRVLAIKRKGIKIGVCLISKKNPFFDDVILGIKKASKELKGYGVEVIIKRLEGYIVDKQLKQLDLFKDVDAYILNPINDPLIEKKINDLVKKKKCVINVNTDTENSMRQCYVGSDYLKGGSIACGVIALLKNKKANVAILGGSENILGHNQRIKGFKEVVNKQYPEIKVLAYAETKDSDVVAYRNTKEILKNKKIDTIFIVAAGVGGVCKAVEEKRNEKEITVISFDDIAITKKMIEKGIIKATICQQPNLQGYRAVYEAYNCLINNNHVENDKIIVNTEIKILESL